MNTTQQVVGALCAGGGAGWLKIAAYVGGVMGAAGLLSNFKNKLPPKVAAVLQLLSGQAIHALELWAKSAPVLLAAALFAGVLAACTPTTATTGGTTTVTVANGWTAASAGNVEFAAAIPIVLELQKLETEVPADTVTIRAAGQAFLAGLQVQVADMTSGQSALVQAKDAALQAVLSQLPNLSSIISDAQLKSGQLSALADALSLLNNNLVYVSPAVLKAVAGTTTPADEATSLATLQAAVAKL